MARQSKCFRLMIVAERAARCRPLISDALIVDKLGKPLSGEKRLNECKSRIQT
jgi:hypothetical protein